MVQTNTYILYNYESPIVTFENKLNNNEAQIVRFEIDVENIFTLFDIILFLFQAYALVQPVTHIIWRGRR